MPRPPRPDLPGIPQYVIQRGNDRQACFFSDDDHQTYLTLLREAAARHDCAVHAYVLMTNHVHLLVSPTAARGVARMMQTLGRGYVGYINARYRRTGTLWEGRYKSCLVDADDYLLTCYRYIELNPVRAGMVERPEAYRWSSHACNAHGAHDAIVRPHAGYLALCASEAARQVAYRALFAEALTPARIADIRAYVQQQKALGGVQFRAQVEDMLEWCMTVRPAHRPSVTRSPTHNGL